MQGGEETKKDLTRNGTLWTIARAPVPAFPSNRRSSPSQRRNSLRGDPVAEKDGLAASMELDREVIRCQVCGLVQYRTRTGNCRRCLRLLPPKVTFVIPTPSPQDLPGDDRQLFENWPNRETVENIGQRIRQLRESRSMTQSQLQARSRVSRSYLSRIESGQMTPSLGTLEKIAEALGVGLNRFFVPETNGETVLEDPFIQGLRPYLRQLDWAQWQGILKRLQAISEHVSTNHHVRPLPPQTVERVPPHTLPRRQQQAGPGHAAAIHR
jgi:transcriptional regulator with XRE-family HTH domain